MLFSKVAVKEKVYII